LAAIGHWPLLHWFIIAIITGAIIGIAIVAIILPFSLRHYYHWLVAPLLLPLLRLALHYAINTY